ACNVPFVTTDVGDLRDIASIESSCRVCPADAELIADNICQILDQEIPQNLDKYVRDMRLESVSKRLVSIYEDLVAA
ncbi:MAG: glycosyltransferase, partial [Woeseiaceae bacterium]